jgi:hypothetical protein
MIILIANVGELRSLENIVNKTAPENLVLRLYTSNTTPAETDTAGSYTEASGNGYAAKTLTGASWTAVATKNAVVDTSGVNVVRQSGDSFTGLIAGLPYTINSVVYTIQSVTDGDNLVLTATAGTQNDVAAASPSFVHYAEQVFTFTGALGNVYGAFLTEVTSGILKGAGRLDSAPYNVASSSHEIRIVIILTAE